MEHKGYKLWITYKGAREREGSKIDGKGHVEFQAFSTNVLTLLLSKGRGYLFSSWIWADLND